MPLPSWRKNARLINERQEDIRIVVIDAHPVVREGLRMMLEIAGDGCGASINC